MGTSEAGKGWYYSLEDRYYGFLDWLDSKGIPIYSVVDPIESAGIPSMPVFIVLILAILLVIGWFFFGAGLGGLFSSEGTVVVLVQDNQGNALQNAVVSFSVNGQSPVSFTTNQNGSIEKSFPSGTELLLSVSKEGFNDSSQSLTVASGNQQAKFLLETSIQTLTKIVNLKTASGALYNKQVSIRFSCSGNNSFSRETTAIQGTVTVENIPLDCGVLIATPLTTGVSFAEGTISLSDVGTAFLSVSETSLETGSVKVTVTNEQGTAVAGANVKLMREDRTQLAPHTSGANGSTVFDKVPVGRYYVIVTYAIPDKQYADFDSSSLSPADIRELQPDGMLNFSVVLHEIVSGRIKLAVTDMVTKQPVANAKVTLLKENVEIDSKSTDNQGLADFPVSESTPIYSVRIDHPSYLIATVPNLAASTQTAMIALQPASPDQATALVVLVLDGDDASASPVENAKVQLKKSPDGEIASETLATGLDGKAVFTRLVPGDYFAYVVKDGFDGITSPVVTVAERQLNQVTAVLRIGSGTLSLSVTDEGQQPVPNARIQMINAFSGTVLEEGANGIDGTKSFTVRADKTVFFRVHAPDFSSYTTVSYTAPVDSTRVISVQLVQDIVKLEAVLEGLYIGDESIGDTLTAGQRYTAKFLLLVPESVDWEEAGIHIRTGSFDEGKTNILESDYAYLGKASSGANTVLRGKSYSPPTGYAEDSKHLTTGNSKWFNATFSNNPKGAFEVQIEVQVIDSAPLGSILPLSYRAFGKSGGSMVRSPVDAVLGNSETASAKQGLYAKTSDRIFTAGPSTLCDDQFCRLFTIQDLGKDLKTMVVDEYPAKISSQYKLFFTLVNKSPIVLPGSELQIANGEGGLAFGDYKVTDAQGRVVNGKASNENQVTVPVGDLGTDSSIFGEISFLTKKDGPNALTLSIQSNEQSVYSKSVSIVVTPSIPMNLDVLPKTIVPFMNNDVLIKTSDSNHENGIAGAAIEVLINGETAVSGTTNGEGIFQFTLQAPAPNTRITINAQKTGYTPVSKEMQVSSNVLSIIPDSVDESLTVTGIYGFEKDFILTNNTTVPLTINDLTASKELSKYLVISSEQNIRGMVLEPGKDTNFLLQVELTDAGKTITEATQLKGTISLSTTLAGNTWVNVIPFNVFIGFGGEVTDQNCLYLEPSGWSISTASTAAQVQQIKITNKCRADESYVPLKDVQARIETTGPDNVLGSFMLSSDLAGSKNIGLSNQFQSLAPQIEANADPSLTLTFIPAENITSGQSTARIVLQASHTASSGIQPITSAVSVSTSINNLAACLSINPTNLIVYSTPPGIGFDVYNRYGYGGGTYSGAPYAYGGSYSGFGRFDYTGNSNLYYNNYLNGTQSIQGNPTLVDYPERLYATNYPYAMYSQPFYDTLAPVASNGMINGYTGYPTNSDYWGQQLGSFNYANAFYGRNNQFRITNNCSSSLDITLDADPALLVNSNSFRIEPDKQQVVPIESAQYYGMYPLNVRAKMSGSKDNSQVIQTLNVNVLPASDPTQYDNCIRLSTTTFKFNDFIQKPVTAKVYNSCYGQGVRLDYDSISFSNMGYGEQLARQEGSLGIIEAIEPVNLITSPANMGSGSQVLEFEIIKNINYRPQIVGTGSLGAGGTEGMVGFRTWATGAYNRVQARAQLVVRYSSPQGFEQRKMFRVIVEDFWNLYGSLPPLDWSGNQFITAKDCVIEDALDFGACIPETEFKNQNTYSTNSRQVLRIGPSPYRSNYPRSYYGMPSSSGYTVANAGSYDGSSIVGGTPYSSGYTYNQLYQPTYASTTYPQPYPYYASNYSVPGATTPFGIGTQSLPAEIVNVCGTLDRVVVKTQTITQNGVKFTFSSGTDSDGKETSGNQRIKLTIDKSGSLVKGDTILDTKISVEVARQTPYGTTSIQLPVHVCVTVGKAADQNIEPGVPQPEIPSSVPNNATPLADLCTQTTPNGGKTATGSEQFNKTFGNLLFNWDWDLGQSGKDPEGKICQSKYCDAVQTTIGLVKKVALLKSTIETNQDIQTALKDNENKNRLNAVVGEKLGDYQNTNNLLRWFKKQTPVITDNAKLEKERYVASGNNAQKTVFFLDNENRVLELETKPEQSAYSAVAQFESETDTGKKLEAMSQLLKELSQSNGANGKADANAVLLLLNWNPTAEEEKTLKALGAENISTDEKNKQFAMTLNEFGYMHEKIRKCIADGKTTDCDFASLTGETTQAITLNFLSQFASNLAVKYAARHTKENLENPDSTYYQFIEKNAGWNIPAETATKLEELSKSTFNLMQDNYSESFRNDFADYYGEQEGIGRAESQSKEIAKKVKKWSFKSSSVNSKPLLQSFVEVGRYETQINYSWNPTATQPVQVSFVSKKLDSDAPLQYRLPFDASLEEVPNELRDYGIAVIGTGSENLVLSARNNQAITPLSNSSQPFQLEYNRNQTPESKQGRILAWSNYKVSFSPTIPYAITMNVSGNNNAILFNFSPEEAAVLNGSIQWDRLVEGKGSENKVCQNGKGDTQYSLLQQNAKGMLFLPESISHAVLELVCSPQGASADLKQATLFWANSGTSQTAKAAKQTRGTLTLSPQPNPNKPFNLKDLAQAIKNREVCVSATTDSLYLAWNPAYFLTGQQ